MTVRVKSTGEEITLKYDDLAKGQFTIKDKDGKTTQLGQADLTKIPAWVPRYPGATGENSALQTEDATQTAGMLTFTTTDTTEACEKFYADAAAKLALTSSSRSASTIEGSNTLSLHYAADKRELTLTVFGKPGEPLTVQEIYTEKK